MLHLHRDERGQSLVIVLSLITIMFLLGSSLAVHGSVALRSTRASEGQGDEFYAADAATELGIWWQRNGKAGNPPAQTINGVTTATTINVAGGGGGSCPASPTPVWMTGFESGYAPLNEIFSGLPPSSGTIQNAGSTRIESTIVRTGNYSMKISPAGGSMTVPLQQNYGVPFGPIVVLHEAIRFAALPTTDAVVQLIGVNGISAGNLYPYYKQSTGKWALASVNASGWASRTEAQASVSAVAGQWHTFDIRFNSTVNPVVIDWYVDGVAQPQITNATTGTPGAVVSWWGQPGLTTSATYTAYYDDIMFSATSADFPLGDVRVSALKPNAMGTHNTPANYQNNDNSAINATSWQRIDEIPMLPSSTADYIKQVTAGGGSYIEIAFEDTTQACVRGASIFFAVHGSGAQNNNAAVNSVANGFNYTLWSGNIASATIKYGQKVASQNALNPGTGPWTQAVINGLVTRFGFSTDVNPLPYLDGIVLEYGWQTVVAGPATVTIVGTGGGSTVTTDYEDAGAGIPTLDNWTVTK